MLHHLPSPHHRWQPVAIAPLPLLLLMMACSSSTPAPTTTNTPVTSAALPAAAPSHQTWEAGGMAGGTGLLGVAQLSLSGLDNGNPIAELTPVRIAQAIGDTFDVDITDFLKSSPCRDCLAITGLRHLGGGLLDIGLVMSHPFQSLAARKDLHVFDARLLVASTTGTLTSAAGLGTGLPGSPNVQVIGDLVTNAAGYTTFFDGVLEGHLSALGLWTPDAANLKPYILLWEDHSSPNYDPLTPTGWGNVDAPQGYNVFPMGGSRSDPRAQSTLQLQLDPGAGQVNLLLAVDAAYGQSAVRATRLTPRYFLPLFQRQEAWKVGMEVLSNDLAAGNPASSATLAVQVYDWQGDWPVDPSFDPGSSALDAIPHAGDIREVQLHVPGVLATPLTVPGGVRSGSGTPADPYQYGFFVLNVLNAAAGDYTAIVRVVDELEGTGSGPTALNRDISTSNFTDFATYQVLTGLTVDTGIPPNLPPVADLEASTLTPAHNQTVTFQPGPGTSDPDGTIILFEYDYDYDGMTFTVDASNATGDPVSTSFSNPGPGSITVDVAMRVTDDGTPGLTGLDVVTLTVSEPPATTLPVWDFEDTADTLASLGFTLLGTNGFTQPPSACTNGLPAGTTWGLVSGIGNASYPGNTTHRALEESGSTAGAGTDNRYYTHVRMAIQSPLIDLPLTSQSLYLDLHHWFQFDLNYRVNGMPEPGRWFSYDGGTVMVHPAPGGVPSGSPVILEPIAAQQNPTTHPFWRTFENGVGVNILNQLFPNWCITNWTAGVHKGFAGVSYDHTVVSNPNPVVLTSDWNTNPAAPTWINSRFDLTPWEGQEIYLEFHFRSKSNTNTGCSGFLGPPCLGCNQNLEALLMSSPNYRISKGWRIDRIAVVEEP